MREDTNRSVALAECSQLWVTHTTSKKAEPTHALRGVDAAIMPGEFLAVVGPSGSGKSSLLHALSGFVQATRGTVSLLGKDITRASQSTVAATHRQGVGFIFQSLNLVPSLPVLDNVMLPSRFAGRRLEPSRAETVLRDLGLGHRLAYRTGDLSGGEQQRVAVARWLYCPPMLLMADEPTGALDSHSGILVLDNLQRLAAAGTAVLLVTHDLDAAARADRVLALRDGELIEQFIRPRREDLLGAHARSTAASPASTGGGPPQDPGIRSARRAVHV